MAGIILACSHSTVVPRYYILSDQSEPASATDSMAKETLPYVAEMGRINISDAYNRERIALRTKRHELNYYYYHLWAQPPATAIRYFVWKRLFERQIFDETILEVVNRLPKYRVIGVVDQIERTGFENNHGAHLKMTLALYDYETGQAVFRHSFDRTETMKAKTDMNTFAAVISDILRQETDRFINKIYRHVKP